MDVATEKSSFQRRQVILLCGVLAVVVACLALGYFLFLRPTYVVLAQDLRPADASAIVAELEKSGKVFKLRDGGATIMVPEAEADATRVAIAGSDAAARGQVGFELFNKSDMGLTNFAQKINYQRALQGELVRTITMMNGVESARVHLAIPERSLFRAERAQPKAAVTVSMKVGQGADPARVLGIQRLVAAAVPDLPASEVVVLDQGGRVISSDVAPEASSDRPADMEERAAVENYYRARIRGAAERQLPGLKFQVRVLVMPLGAEPNLSPEAQAGQPQWTPSGEGASRNFRLRVIFVTLAGLGAEDQAAVRAAMEGAGLDASQGDSVLFETGPVDHMELPAAQVATAPALLPSEEPGAPVAPTAAPASFPIWVWGAALFVLLAIAGWRLWRPEAPRLSEADHDAFAAHLRRQLSRSGEANDAAS